MQAFKDKIDLTAAAERLQSAASSAQQNAAEGLQSASEKTQEIQNTVEASKDSLRRLSKDTLSNKKLRRQGSTFDASQANEKRQDISPGLANLHNAEASAQAEFWQSVIVQPRATQLSKIGGLPPDSIANDILARYFDSSHFGISLVYNDALNEQKRKDMKSLDKDGLYLALSVRLNFFEVIHDNDELYSMLANESNEEFETLCQVVGLPCDKNSFGYTVRRLRIGLLLRYYSLERKGKGVIYHTSYDEFHLYSPFNKSEGTTTVHDGLKRFTVPVVLPQSPVENCADYFFVGKTSYGGRVHWSHLHSPGIELVLAVGQVWRLPGPALSMLCDLEHARPHLYSHPNDPKTTDADDKQDENLAALACKFLTECPSDDQDQHGLEWSYLVMPQIVLSRESQENLDLYRLWLTRKHEGLEIRQEEMVPPAVHVCLVQKNLCIMWSSVNQNVFTVESEPSYIGKWRSDKPGQPKPWREKLIEIITCADCCCRRKDKRTVDGRGSYQRVPDEEEGGRGEHRDVFDLKACDVCGEFHEMSGLSISHKLWEATSGKKAETGFKEATFGQKAPATDFPFEMTFSQVLSSLSSKNSILRASDEWHMISRVVRNRAGDYLNALAVYEAAITRLKYLVEDPAEKRQKRITRIENVKLELNALHRMVKPFETHVCPELQKLACRLHDKYPLVYHNLMEVQNVMRSFEPKWKSLIQQCDLIIDEYDREKQNMTNQVLNILTFITFIITPLQIMTGIYGMNFKHMSELEWSHGYKYYFWGLACTLTALFALILICLQKKAL
jgi:hypothetical protein